jgi:hypothetical protein
MIALFFGNICVTFIYYSMFDSIIELFRFLYDGTAAFAGIPGDASGNFDNVIGDFISNS